MTDARRGILHRRTEGRRLSPDAFIDEVQGTLAHYAELGLSLLDALHLNQAIMHTLAANVIIQAPTDAAREGVRAELLALHEASRQFIEAQGTSGIVPLNEDAKPS